MTTSAPTDIYTLSLHDALPIWKSLKTVAILPQSVAAAEQYLNGESVHVDQVDRKRTRLNSSHLGSSYDDFGSNGYLHSFPTRRSSDLEELEDGGHTAPIRCRGRAVPEWRERACGSGRSEENTSELQSLRQLV